MYVRATYTEKEIVLTLPAAGSLSTPSGCCDTNNNLSLTTTNVCMECRSLLLGAAAGAAAFAILDRLRRRRLRGGTYHAGMIRARPELIEQYQQLHDKTWEEVMARMYASNMRDFTEVVRALNSARCFWTMKYAL